MAVRPPASTCASSDAESDDAKVRSEGMSHVRAALSSAAWERRSLSRAHRDRPTAHGVSEFVRSGPVIFGAAHSQVVVFRRVDFTETIISQMETNLIFQIWVENDGERL